MKHEQLSLDSEAKLQQEAEIDVLVRKIETLVMGYDVDEMRMAVKVMSNLPHIRLVGGELVPESLREHIHREVTDEISR